MLTDRELQTLRNMGNEAEEAADEIENLRADLANARGARDFALAVAREAQEIARMAQAATPAPAPTKPPKHRFWGAGEAECPAEIKAPNGELHSRRCKVCGATNPRDQFCWQATTTAPAEPAWMAAFDEARDAILNDRGPLEGEAMSDTQTNAVLSILDDAFMPHLKRGAIAAAPEPAQELPPLPKAKKLRREMRPNGGFELVPAYTADQMHAYARAALAATPAPAPHPDTADAERYRWLRDEADYLRIPEGSPQVLMTDEWGVPVSIGLDAYPRGKDLDAAIDAARGIGASTKESNQ